MSYNQVKDSGKRQEFNTGSVRDVQEGKGRFDLLPFIALTRLAKHYENGSVKYGDNNWRKGQPLMLFFSSAMRHMFRWAMGWKDEDHLSAAIWNLCSILETEEMIRRGKLPQELDDRYEGLLDDYEWQEQSSITVLPFNQFKSNLSAGYIQTDDKPIPVVSGQVQSVILNTETVTLNTENRAKTVTTFQGIPVSDIMGYIIHGKIPQSYDRDVFLDVVGEYNKMHTVYK